MKRIGRYSARNEEMTSTTPLVSVIVPFYNGELFVQDCLDSLVNQDFDRYEIVCIDDGSNDRTGVLLNQYADQYPFVQVYHFENAGLSVARNRGVALAKSELVTFVDGDDLVSPCYVRELYEAHRGIPGRMVQVSYTYGEREALLDCVLSQSKRAGSICVVEGNAAVRKAYLLGEIHHTAWGSLAERILYERVPFKPGVLFEDIISSVDLATQMTEAVIINAELYGYVQRVGSICNPREPDLRLPSDYHAAIHHVLNETSSWGEDLQPFVSVKAARLYSTLCSRALALGWSGEWKPYLAETRQFVWENRSGLVRAVKEGLLSPRTFVVLVVKAWCPWGYLLLRGPYRWGRLDCTGHSFLT